MPHQFTREKAEPSTRSGVLLIDKPEGLTSHDVVARTRRLAGTRKVGHAGTLDPMATGLLVLGVNASTRLLTYVVGLDKEYLATIRLGVATTTDDREGEIVSVARTGAVSALGAADIRSQIDALTGDIEQTPSSVSAIKVDGKRAYALVREGVEVQLKSRPVTVSEFEILDQRAASTEDGADALDIDVRVVCSSGTYIRALARDLGGSLGVGGHLTALRRTRIGPFSVAEASDLETVVVAEALEAPAATASRLFTTLELTQEQSVDLGHGKRLALSDDVPDAVGPVAAIAPDGRLVGLVSVTAGRAKSLVNFPADPEQMPNGASE
ncbi:tRNA pseudouridine(55) synthase TruB [Agreia pratensis]|uniref:tRNA pseudouridine synthase B n=1 Tax=Agreia pratensis TaxID=150121 RepID=A0A1X7K7V8_9MICO|nr:tRNA pseudouridine(55) synthase TruB [Agreia pratensis]MBF4634321.1 tRNA pseudouridine(55) synthase TruB [Agreia pratensis]SMG36422.1 tRNA pseudouridine synthase B [Agreia pratensis]